MLIVLVAVKKRLNSTQVFVAFYPCAITVFSVSYSLVPALTFPVPIDVISIQYLRSLPCASQACESIVRTPKTIAKGVNLKECQSLKKPAGLGHQIGIAGIAPDET